MADLCHGHVFIVAVLVVVKAVGRGDGRRQRDGLIVHTFRGGQGRGRDGRCHGIRRAAVVHSTDVIGDGGIAGRVVAGPRDIDELPRMVADLCHGHVFIVAVPIVVKAVGRGDGRRQRDGPIFHAFRGGQGRGLDYRSRGIRRAAAVDGADIVGDGRVTGVVVAAPRDIDELPRVMADLFHGHGFRLGLMVRAVPAVRRGDGRRQCDGLILHALGGGKDVGRDRNGVGNGLAAAGIRAVIGRRRLPAHGGRSVLRPGDRVELPRVVVYGRGDGKRFFDGIIRAVRSKGIFRHVIAGSARSGVQQRVALIIRDIRFVDLAAGQGGKAVDLREGSAGIRLAGVFGILRVERHRHGGGEAVRAGGAGRREQIAVHRKDKVRRMLHKIRLAVLLRHVVTGPVRGKEADQGAVVIVVKPFREKLFGIIIGQVGLGRIRFGRRFGQQHDSDLSAVQRSHDLHLPENAVIRGRILQHNVAVIRAVQRGHIFGTDIVVPDHHRARYLEAAAAALACLDEYARAPAHVPVARVHLRVLVVIDEPRRPVAGDGAALHDEPAVRADPYAAAVAIPQRREAGRIITQNDVLPDGGVAGHGEYAVSRYGVVVRALRRDIHAAAGLRRAVADDLGVAGHLKRAAEHINAAAE